MFASLTPTPTGRPVSCLLRQEVNPVFYSPLDRVDVGAPYSRRWTLRRCRASGRQLYTRWCHPRPRRPTGTRIGVFLRSCPFLHPYSSKKSYASGHLSRPRSSRGLSTRFYRCELFLSTLRTKIRGASHRSSRFSKLTVKSSKVENSRMRRRHTLLVTVMFGKRVRLFNYLLHTYS